MCLNVSRTPLLALVMGIYLELSIRNGICDDSHTSSSYQRTKENNDSLHPRHAHTWKGWEDWLPSSTTEGVEAKRKHHNEGHYIPLSLSEQAKLRSRKNRKENTISSWKVQDTLRKPAKESKETKENLGTGKAIKPEDFMSDLKSMRDTAKYLASSVINQFVSSWTLDSSKPQTKVSSPFPRDSRGIYLDNLSNRQDGQNHGKPEREAKRGVIDWLSRLIGVQGKTLGEFLREYQVHVLYDLAFTFFKWIFFLYAGLLIP